MKDMKKAVTKAALSITIGGMIFLIVVPIAVVLLGGKGNMELNNPNNYEGWEHEIETPKEICVWRTSSGQAEMVDFEEYVCCVVASEMPSSFHMEAIKAQAVAARTYAMAKVLKYEENIPQAHEKAPVCDQTHCQVYRSEKELLATHSKDWMDSEEGFLKVKEACKQTEGQLLYYEESLVMQPLFFSSSGGYTENSQDVFASALPYLVSVPSPYEEKATHQNEIKSMDMREFEAKMKEYLPNLDFGHIAKENIEILSRTQGGRADKISVGNCQVKGTDVRSAIGLSSSMFSIDFENNTDGDCQIVFTSSGFGHGVGMSQYGADGMAKKGYGYEEILGHYYTNTKVH